MPYCRKTYWHRLSGLLKLMNEFLIFKEELIIKDRIASTIITNFNE